MNEMDDNGEQVESLRLWDTGKGAVLTPGGIIGVDFDHRLEGDEARRVLSDLQAGRETTFEGRVWFPHAFSSYQVNAPVAVIQRGVLVPGGRP